MWGVWAPSPSGHFWGGYPWVHPPIFAHLGWGRGGGAKFGEFGPPAQVGNFGGGYPWVHPPIFAHLSWERGCGAKFGELGPQPKWAILGGLPVGTPPDLCPLGLGAGRRS